MPITILVADDHDLMRNSLQFILEKADKDFTVVALAENGKQAVELAMKEKPDVILMDIDMPVMGGIEATRLLTEQFPNIGIVAFSMSAERSKVREMISAGARGYLLKSSDKADLRTAIKTVHAGSRYFCEEVKKYVNAAE
jgi:DNA-binding NarL/FixJ family response regulator